MGSTATRGKMGRSAAGGSRNVQRGTGAMLAGVGRAGRTGPGKGSGRRRAAARQAGGARAGQGAGQGRQRRRAERTGERGGGNGSARRQAGRAAAAAAAAAGAGRAARAARKDEEKMSTMRYRKGVAGGAGRPSAAEWPEGRRLASRRCLVTAGGKNIGRNTAQGRDCRRLKT